MSARLKLTFSYAGLVMLAGSLLIGVAWIFALRWLPDNAAVIKNAQQYAPKGMGNSPVVITGPSQSDLMHGFIPAAAVAVAFLLLLGLVGGWFLAGRMLAPLTRIADATRLAATGSLSHRIELEGTNDEFRELADAFDTMLAQLEAHVAEQRRFAANASHELRTPLAITQSLLDAARNDPDRDTGQLIDRLHVVNTRAIDLTEALLLLSRANQRSFAREEVDLSLVAEEAAETLFPMAERRGLTIETIDTSGGAAPPAIGSPALLLQLATNLVHNAIVHNLPGQGTIWVITSAHADYAELTVENTGEQLTPELVATLAEPFQRGSERIRTDHAGVGLGLAIVKSITYAHDGTLTLTPRPTGGLRVTVRLPVRRALTAEAPEARYIPTALRLARIGPAPAHQPGSPT
ncbi:histidine kinase [Catenulispora acidiphila DSM 44928]|uniref:histidine kinase n=1 Tax=Catenulispora acidiphila (strain DSM 44928 / JCM 14897 / NBRC 102108 / NRRL B-24433 / ID139908) TaxID=479433 RepID=C7QDM3_CATAD|nr:HAMP domain-containing sensor histidine kinase [Catenulispora acidiphila]ACU74647.1 histidine kinase [Catenulispora acidiphila DSM 44928]